MDETYVKVAGTWRYLYRAVDQQGQVFDGCISKAPAARHDTQYATNRIDDHGRELLDQHDWAMRDQLAPALSDWNWVGSYRRGDGTVVGGYRRWQRL